MVSNSAVREFHNVSSKRQTVVLWQISVWALTLAGVFFLVAGVVLDSERLVACSTAVIPSLLIAAYQHVVRERELFAPLNFVFLTVIMGVTFQTIYLCFMDDGGHRFALGRIIDINSLMTAVAAISIGIAGLLAGYAIPGRKFQGSRAVLNSSAWRVDRMRIAVTIMSVISFLSLLYFAAVFDIWENITSQFSVGVANKAASTKLCSLLLGFWVFSCHSSQAAG